MPETAWILGDDAASARQLRLGLEREGWEARSYGSAKEALAALATTRPDLIIAACLTAERDGLALLRSAKALDRRIPVLLVVGPDDVQVAVDAIRAGAQYCLTRPVTAADLKPLLDLNRGIEGGGDPIDTAVCSLAGFVGGSPRIQDLRITVARILEAERHMAPGDLPAILITGETGTGKELVARALHFDGLRREGPFVEINCASIPSNLLETELFGHERGAFTDAKDRKPGLVEAAEGGTLFLDEIGEVAPVIQAKLLKLLEEKTVRRIGSVHERKVNIRIISATNQDLEQLVRNGRFRSDLYFRLRIITISLPPLRERGDDALALARHFLQIHGRRYGKPDLMLSPKAEQLLLAYPWPGNVRELKNLLEQTVLLARDRVIQPEAIAVSTSSASRDDAPPAAKPQPEPRRTAAVSPAAAFAAGMKLSEVERDLLLKTLEKVDWNVAKAARLLGITRDKLRIRIKRHGLASGQAA